MARALGDKFILSQRGVIELKTYGSKTVYFLEGRAATKDIPELTAVPGENPIGEDRKIKKTESNASFRSNGKTENCFM